MTFNTKHAYKKIGRQFIDVQLKNFSKQDLINYGRTLPDESVFTLLYCKGWLTTSCKRFDSNGQLIHEKCNHFSRMVAVAVRLRHRELKK